MRAIRSVQILQCGTSDNYVTQHGAHAHTKRLDTLVEGLGLKKIDA